MYLDTFPPLNGMQHCLTVSNRTASTSQSLSLGFQLVVIQWKHAAAAEGDGMIEQCIAGWFFKMHTCSRAKLIPLYRMLLKAYRLTRNSFETCLWVYWCISVRYIPGIHCLRFYSTRCSYVPLPTLLTTPAFSPASVAVPPKGQNLPMPPLLPALPPAAASC